MTDPSSVPIAVEITRGQSATSMLVASEVLRKLETASRLRNMIVHRAAHSAYDVVWWIPSTAALYLGQAKEYDCYLAQSDARLRPSISGTSDDTVLELPPRDESAEPWSRLITSVGTTTLTQPPREFHDYLPVGTIYPILVRLENTGWLIRFLDGILAALSLLLLAVLTALSGHVDLLVFVLVLLAACLRYGRRDEPAAHPFLPIRRNQTLPASCLQA